MALFLDICIDRHNWNRICDCQFNDADADDIMYCVFKKILNIKNKKCNVFTHSNWKWSCLNFFFL